MESYTELLDQIQEIRARNNKHWMDIMRLAFREAPEEARSLMGKIAECDGEIMELSRKLVMLGDSPLDADSERREREKAEAHNW